MKIAIGGDHAGFYFKKEIIDFLSGKSYEVKDCGPFTSNTVDYPDFAHMVALSIENQQSELGILICGSGNGVAITANKHKNIRAALCWNVDISKLAKAHNNANVLCIPARFISLDDAIEIVKVFLETEFEGGKHQARVEKISC